MKVERPIDPRLQPLIALRTIIPLPNDAGERKLLHRIDVKQAVAK